MDEATAKDRLIEEMRENKRLRARVAELEADLEVAESRKSHVIQDLKAESAKWELAARALSRVLGYYSQRIADGKPIDTLRTADAWLREALPAPNTQEVEG